MELATGVAPMVSTIVYTPPTQPAADVGIIPYVAVPSVVPLFASTSAIGLAHPVVQLVFPLTPADTVDVHLNVVVPLVEEFKSMLV